MKVSLNEKVEVERDYKSGDWTVTQINFRGDRHVSWFSNSAALELSQRIQESQTSGPKRFEKSERNSKKDVASNKQFSL